jgi:hypothetical protein
MIVECFNKGNGVCTLKIEFQSPRDVHTVLSGYAFDEPHDVYVDGKAWGEWQRALVVPATLDQLPEDPR